MMSVHPKKLKAAEWERDRTAVSQTNTRTVTDREIRRRRKPSCLLEREHPTLFLERIDCGSRRPVEIVTEQNGDSDDDMKSTINIQNDQIVPTVIARSVTYN
jgi:hypothetical protein